MINKTIFEGHRVHQVVSSAIPWVDTYLSTIVVIARGTPDVKILSYKHSESKFYHFYTIKGISKDAAEDGQAKPETSYLDFPSKIEISKEGLFLLITTYSGAVHLLRLPEPLNPMKNMDTKPKAEVPADGVTMQLPEPSVGSFLKTDIEGFEHKNLEFSK